MPEPPAGHVLVLHGWGLSGFAMRGWCRRLRRSGFAASAYSYPSLSATLDENAQALAVSFASLPGRGRIHLVGHSMGGILILHTLARHRLERLGRVVLVGTPFQGSAVAHRLQAYPAGRWLLGRSIGQWSPTGASELPTGVQLGTIAGTTPLGMGRLVCRLTQPHDGTVTLAETRVPFATDSLVLSVTHTQMLISSGVTSQIVRFLRTGAFLHQGLPTP
jgi:pimeloyl-ACP methyl ester carboxylesterase